MSVSINPDFRDFIDAFNAGNVDYIAVGLCGNPPVSIDILTNVKGLVFEDAFRQAIDTVLDNTPIKVLELRDLNRAKKQLDDTKA